MDQDRAGLLREALPLQLPQHSSLLKHSDSREQDTHPPQRVMEFPLALAGMSPAPQLNPSHLNHPKEGNSPGEQTELFSPSLFQYPSAGGKEDAGS